MAHGIHDDKAIPWTAMTSERSKTVLDNFAGQKFHHSGKVLILIFSHKILNTSRILFNENLDLL